MTLNTHVAFKTVMTESRDELKSLKSTLVFIGRKRDCISYMMLSSQVYRLMSLCIQ